MKKIKIAQIGAGHDHASMAISTLKLQSDLYELEGYAAVPENSENPFSYEYERELHKLILKACGEEIK